MVALLVALATAVLPQLAPQAAPSRDESTVPSRVFDTRTSAFTDFEVMLGELASADVVLIGEQHDHANTHRFESALLDALARRNVLVTLSLEMFERDVQPALDDYLGGRRSEVAFLEGSRPWPRYATDYRALVELAKRQSWPVLAANVPRRYASDIAKNGLAPLDSLAPAERQFVARDLECPKDGYFDRFAATMRDHPAPAGARDPEAARAALIERYYQSQCAKDETMAESIAAAVDRRGAGAGPLVHITGAFHSDFGAGTAERVRRRLPSRRVIVLSLLAAADLDAAPAPHDVGRAEYLVYTRK